MAVRGAMPDYIVCRRKNDAKCELFAGAIRASREPQFESIIESKASPRSQRRRIKRDREHDTPDMDDHRRFNELLGLNLTLSLVARIVDECPGVRADGHGMGALLDRRSDAAWDIAWFLLREGRLKPAAIDILRGRLPNRATIVAAVGRNGQIGLEGRIPWRVPADLAHFKALTAGGTVLVGRKTFESMGPLKGRTVVVVSSGPVPGADRVIADPFDPSLPKDRLFVCGGSAIYRAYLDVADRMVLSRVEYDGPADAFFPSEADIADAGWLQIGPPRQETGFVVHEFVRRP